MRLLRILRFVFAFLLPVASLAQGTVLIVVGSDTGVWDGLNVAHHYCTVGSTLYTDPNRNASRVMDPAFRGPLVDSYGTPMKLTWWMMAGNMFRLSTNTDVPTPSTLPVYLMKRYHGNGLARWGDELTFHFHDWIWSDENGDGTWFWNQASTFADAREDFDRTLAELLIEEKMFPVSFRSGWHAMDDIWQQRLDEVLPFSLHNAYPSKNVDPIEPFDNIYDWSRSPSQFVPFHPSTLDYQVAGDGRGWNVRSLYMASADSTVMARMFQEAQAGTDQVVCLWAHLPESDFPDNLQKVNRSVHAAASAFPTVPFRYCTAVEAMQRWRRTVDTTKPTITWTEHRGGTNIGWTITVDEPIFQPSPIVAIKDRYAEHRLLPMIQISQKSWQTISPVPVEDLVGFSVAVTDTSGNLALLHHRYMPEDVFVDNAEPGFEELAGDWTTVPLKGWGASYRTTVNAVDSATARWTATVPSRGTYGVFLRIPTTGYPAGSLHVTLANGPTLLDTVITPPASVIDRWLHIAVSELEPDKSVTLQVTARPLGMQSLTADVLRITPMVPPRSVSGPDMIDVDDIMIGTVRNIRVPYHNHGSENATIQSAHLASGNGVVINGFPLTIPAMGVSELIVSLYPEGTGPLRDTLIVLTDDERHRVIRSVVATVVREYFILTDDVDTTGYREIGTWRFSNSSAEGPTSRYAAPSPDNNATFSASIEKAGMYEISEIVPATANASQRARYILSLAGTEVDTTFIDQNMGSGDWTLLFTTAIPAHCATVVSVVDAMSPVIPGRVLRTDAIQFQWVSDAGTTFFAPEATLPRAISLLQNYPNPFNPETVIRYVLPLTSHVSLAVYDVLGREIASLVEGERTAGDHAVTWNARSQPSGIYFCTLQSGAFRMTRRLNLLK